MSMSCDIGPRQPQGLRDDVALVATVGTNGWPRRPTSVDVKSVLLVWFDVSDNSLRLARFKRGLMFVGASQCRLPFHAGSSASKTVLRTLLMPGGFWEPAGSVAS